jgi:hypothetical protein
MNESIHGQGFVLVASLFLLGLILELVRRKKIGERYSLLWIIIAVGLCLSATVGLRILFAIAPRLGVVSPATGLFLLAFLGLTVLSVYFTVILTQLSEQNRMLAQRVAFLEHENAERARSDHPTSTTAMAPHEVDGS